MSKTQYCFKKITSLILKNMINLKPIVDPIVLATTFIQPSPCQEGYGRVDNPTRLILEKRLAELEKARFALVFSSGSAAVATVLSSLKKGDHIICHEETYEGTLRLLEKVFKKFGVGFSLVNLSKEKDIKKCVKKNTRLIWLENITNPTLKTLNVRSISYLVNKSEIKIVVDNTFATPVFNNPLKNGADIVLHSLTKFISGHHDVIAGAVMLNDEKIFKKLKFLQQTMGVIPSAFDCFLIMRGIETLNLRMKKHWKNAKIITRFLSSHSKVEKVSFPGIGGVVSFWIKGDENMTLKFIKKLKIIKTAHSFGGTKSTILHPISMMTFSLKKEKLRKIGITDTLVRLSVGLEKVNDLINDLKKSLD